VGRQEGEDGVDRAARHLFGAIRTGVDVAVLAALVAAVAEVDLERLDVSPAQRREARRSEQGQGGVHAGFLESMAARERAQRRRAPILARRPGPKGRCRLRHHGEPVGEMPNGVSRDLRNRAQAPAAPMASTFLSQRCRCGSPEATEPMIVRLTGAMPTKPRMLRSRLFTLWAR